VSDPPGYDTLETAAPGPDPDAVVGFPWPPPEDASLVTGLVETWRRSVFRPRDFFAALPSGHTGAAVLYYLVIGITVAALQLFWDTVLPPGGASWLGIPDPASRISPLTGFLLSPLYLLASLLLAAAITHLLVLVLVPARREFSTTLRVFAYAYSPLLFTVVPRVGQLIGFVWMLVIAVIGIREAHRTTTGRAVTAVIVPLVVAIVVGTVAALLLAATAVLLTP
jgi:hypothetical protein